MASFAQNLWDSIFTPGPTPTLLVATNATFAVLQVLLAALLLATYSVHFLVLSVLSGGLWAAINWFARELRAHQQREEEEEAKVKEKARRGAAPQAAAGSSPSDGDDNSETEIEGPLSSSRGVLRSKGAPPTAGGAAAVASAVSTEAELAETGGEVKLRVAAATVLEVPRPGSSTSQGLRSGVSTEDEWEKVSENEKDR
jgi:hypothetical protein